MNLGIKKCFHHQIFDLWILYHIKKDFFYSEYKYYYYTLQRKAWIEKMIFLCSVRTYVPYFYLFFAKLALFCRDNSFLNFESISTLIRHLIFYMQPSSWRLSVYLSLTKFTSEKCRANRHCLELIKLVNLFVYFPEFVIDCRKVSLR